MRSFNGRAQLFVWISIVHAAHIITTVGSRLGIGLNATAVIRYTASDLMLFCTKKPTQVRSTTTVCYETTMTFLRLTLNDPRTHHRRPHPNHHDYRYQNP